MEQYNTAHCFEQKDLNPKTCMFSKKCNPGYVRNDEFRCVKGTQGVQPKKSKAQSKGQPIPIEQLELLENMNTNLNEENMLYNPRAEIKKSIVPKKTVDLNTKIKKISEIEEKINLQQARRGNITRQINVLKTKINPENGLNNEIERITELLEEKFPLKNPIKTKKINQPILTNSKKLKALNKIRELKSRFHSVLKNSNETKKNKKIVHFLQNNVKISRKDKIKSTKNILEKLKSQFSRKYKTKPTESQKLKKTSTKSSNKTSTKVYRLDKIIKLQEIIRKKKEAPKQLIKQLTEFETLKHLTQKEKEEIDYAFYLFNTYYYKISHQKLADSPLPNSQEYEPYDKNNSEDKSQLAFKPVKVISPKSSASLLSPNSTASLLSPNSSASLLSPNSSASLLSLNSFEE